MRNNEFKPILKAFKCIHSIAVIQCNWINLSILWEEFYGPMESIEWTGVKFCWVEEVIELKI